MPRIRQRHSSQIFQWRELGLTFPSKSFLQRHNEADNVAFGFQRARTFAAYALT